MSAPKLSPLQGRVLAEIHHAEKASAAEPDKPRVHPNFAGYGRWPGSTIDSLLRRKLAAWIGHYSLTDAGREALAELDAIEAVRL